MKQENATASLERHQTKSALMIDRNEKVFDKDTCLKYDLKWSKRMQSPKMVKNKQYQTDQLKQRGDRMRVRRKTQQLLSKRTDLPQPVGNQSHLAVMDTAELSQTNTTYMRCASRELPDSPTQTTKDNRYGSKLTKLLYNEGSDNDSATKLNVGEIDIGYLRGNAISINNQNYT